MHTKEYSPEDIRFSWRLLAGPALGQLIGLAVGYLVTLDQRTFLSVWIGGAAGTCVGFWYGVWWYFKDNARRKKKPYFTMGFIGIISNIFGVIAVIMLFGSAGFSHNLAQLKSLQRTQLSKIVITEESGNDPLVTIDDVKVLSEFCYACRDAKKYIPKANYNLKLKFSCYADFSGSLPYGLHLSIYEDDNNRVICTFAKREGNSTSYHGTFESDGLRTWFDTYIKPRINAKT